MAQRKKSVNPLKTADSMKPENLRKILTINKEENVNFELYRNESLLPNEQMDRRLTFCKESLLTSQYSKVNGVRDSLRFQQIIRNSSNNRYRGVPFKCIPVLVVQDLDESSGTGEYEP